MPRCSDCGNRCSCIIKPGANITISGTGTVRDPYVVEAAGGDGASGWFPGDLKATGASVAPAGWLMANGQAVSRNTYAALFAAIGTTFGVGDGAMTFNVPDLADAFPLGAGGTWALGASGGAASTVLTMNHIPLHSHTMNHSHTASADVQGSHTHLPPVAVVDGGPAGANRTLYATNTPRWSNGDSANETTAAGAHSHNITVNTFTGSTGNAGQSSPTAVPTMPPYVAVNYMIKT